jgi:glycosyltransferase involved in cell wall biosynthesis
MKILLANKFYYPRGGDCIYTIELEKLLKEKGHEVAVFSMQHPSNLDSEYSGYFPTQVDFNRRNLRSLISLLVRPFGSREVRRKFTRLLDDFKPDIIHLNNIHSQLSPVIAMIGHKHKIPVVWTLHDYKLVCPAYLMLSDNKPCEACLENKWSVVRKKCIKNSLMASLVAYFEAIFWNYRKLNRITSKFISPSNFLKEKMAGGGLDSAKIEVAHNFINTSEALVHSKGEGSYYCYIGRLSPEKGIETLLEAAAGLPQYQLKVVGTGPLEEGLITKYRNSHIQFVGYKTGAELQKLLAESRFMVIPSNWYENNPLTILESLCAGIPVIGSDIGGIPELIKPGFNGLLFEVGNVRDLQVKISHLWQNSENYKNSVIATDAINRFKPQSYYSQIIGIYDTLVNNQHKQSKKFQ